MADFKYDIVRNIKVIGEDSRGWTKELNLVSWNERSPKLDLRDWNHDENKMGKGLTLTNEEARNLLEALQSIENELK